LAKESIGFESEQSSLKEMQNENLIGNRINLRAKIAKHSRLDIFLGVLGARIYRERINSEPYNWVSVFRIFSVFIFHPSAFP
jgi:hypothetical protein